MEFKEIISVSKLPGLFQIHKQRADGLIVKSLIDKKIVFVASRAHAFTPLENITIYTNDEPIELLSILLKMKESKITIPDAKASNDILKSYFIQIVPEYDTERVYVSDIQKIIKWYDILDKKGAIQAEPKVKTAAKSEDEATKPDQEAPAEIKAAKPKAKATKKKEKE